MTMRVGGVDETPTRSRAQIGYVVSRTCWVHLLPLARLGPRGSPRQFAAARVGEAKTQLRGVEFPVYAGWLLAVTSTP